MQVPSPLTELRDERLSARAVRLYLKRDDLISPDIPGNKWRKLKYNLEAARAQGHRVLLTFGGAYSNHIRATAAAGHYFGFATVGVIRGEEHRPRNPSLDYAVRHGMRLVYLDRATYRHKMGPAVIAALRGRFGDFYLLPEGGSNAVALRGCAEIAAEIGRPSDLICCPCGTGGTLAGLAHGLRPGGRALGFSVLKAASSSKVTCGACSRRRSAPRRETGRSSTISTSVASPSAHPCLTSSSPTLKNATRSPWTGYTPPK